MGLAENQNKYLTKVVMFKGEKMTLFSLDGNTWSSRKMELAEIKLRHETQRAELAGKKEDEAVPVVAKAVPAEEDDGLDEVIVRDYDDKPMEEVDDDIVEGDAPFVLADIDDDVEEEAPSKVRDISSGKSKQVKGPTKLPIKPVAAKKKPTLVEKKKVSAKPAKAKKASKPVQAKKSKAAPAKKRKAA